MGGRITRFALLVAALILTGCGDDEGRTATDGRAGSTTSTTPTAAEVDGAGEPSSERAPGSFEFRPVLQVLPWPAPTPDVPEGCTTSAEDWRAEGEVFAVDRTAEPPTCYRLGPTQLTRDIVAQASAEELGPGGTWAVALTLHEDRMDEFNAVTAACFARAPTCPSQHLAIISDRSVSSAPSIQVPTFDRRDISISGPFDQPTAEALAASIG